MKYIGALLPDYHSYRFVNSVFEEAITKKKYLALENDGLILEFELLKIDLEIMSVKENIFVEIGDKYIYSFVTPENEIIVGNKQTMEIKLLKILESNEINSRIQLMISTFLNLYNRSLDLLEFVNSDLNKIGCNTLITDDNIFSGRIKVTDENKKKSLDNILNITLSPDIRIEEKLFFYDDKVYFENYVFDANYFISELMNRNYKDLVTTVINICSYKNKINIEKLSNNNSTYEFLLFSDEISLNQNNIEKYLTSQNSENENLKSIIYVGLEMDKEFERVAKKLGLKSLDNEKYNIGKVDNEEILENFENKNKVEQNEYFGAFPTIVLEDEKVLWESFDTIINKNQSELAC